MSAVVVFWMLDDRTKIVKDLDEAGLTTTQVAQVAPFDLEDDDKTSNNIRPVNELGNEESVPLEVQEENFEDKFDESTPYRKEEDAQVTPSNGLTSSLQNICKDDVAKSARSGVKEASPQQGQVFFFL